MQEHDRLRVAVTRPSLPGDALEKLAAEHELVRRESHTPASEDEVVELVRGADALVAVGSDQVTAEVAKAGEDLRIVGNFGAGVDNYDLPAFTARGIPVGNTPGAVTEATADMTWLLLLGVARRLPEALTAVRKGEWPGKDLFGLLGTELSEATLGIVGYGEIGKAVARRAHGFGMRVRHHARTAVSDELSTWVPFEELLSVADVVTLHTPLTEETRGMIGADELEAMKPSAILVNTARGPVVDHRALVDALRSGAIGGAGLDVTDPEPLPPEHPLLGLPNCLVVPHLGTATLRTRSRMAERCMANVRAGLAGERLRWCANPEVYDGPRR